MVWLETRNHVDDCYFWITKTFGYSKKAPQKISYPGLDSVICPLVHSDEVPVPVFTELTSLEDENDMCVSDENHAHIKMIQTLQIQ